MVNAGSDIISRNMRCAITRNPHSGAPCGAAVSNRWARGAWHAPATHASNNCRLPSK